MWLYIIVEKEVEVQVTSGNKRHYEKLGYDIPLYKDDHYRWCLKQGTKILVSVNDLPKNSHVKIHYKCDNCGKIGFISYQEYCKSLHDGYKYCNKCSANIITKQKWIDKYGVDCVLLSSDVKEKSKQTMLRKYGAENAFSSEIIKEKIKQSNLENLGVEYPMQSEQIQNKSKRTCLKKYGVPYSFQSEEVRRKGIESMVANNTVPTSKQQVSIYNMLQEKYGQGNVELNFPLSNIALDVKLQYGDVLFDIEYDCYYWHKDKQHYDRRRDEFTKSQGYRILRIKSGHKIPSIEEIDDKINNMITNNHTYSEIIMDDWGK